MKIQYRIIFILLGCIYSVSGQDVDVTEHNELTFNAAYELAYEGKNSKANTLLGTIVTQKPTDTNAKSLYASTFSWESKYERARSQFNKVLSEDKYNRDAWISAVKNELYAKNFYVALGLSNKGLKNLDNDVELERLKALALKGIEEIQYSEKAWYNVDSKISTKSNAKNSKKEASTTEAKDSASADAQVLRKTPVTQEVEKNRISVNSMVTVFDQRFDPVTSSSISYKRQTEYGSIIPRINYGNRQGKNGVQYDIDLYPKIAKGFYAYVNYGYSNSELYPNHKVGGDIYYNHKSGIEFSGGGRYISFATRDVKSITNSLGYYRGNYYFSLRSFITPGDNIQLTRTSGNILVRKYLKDAENYLGVNFGIGFSPELRQFSSGNQILAETLLYIESQRLSFEYQFTTKNSLSSYRTSLGILRQEQSFDPGSFFYSFSAGLTYQFNF